MKFSELEPGDTFRIEQDGRRFMKIDSGVQSINATILYCPANARTGACLNFSPDQQVNYLSSTQLAYSPNR